MLEAASKFDLDFDEKKDLVALDISDDKESSVSVSLEYFRKILNEDKRPSAMICSGAPGCRAAIFAAMEAGLKVPSDLSVVAISASWEAKGSCPSLSSLERDSETMMMRGISLLQRLMRGNRIRPTTIHIPLKLVIRNSTGKFN